MKTEEIIEGNKLIAEFMGATISTHGVFECANFQDKTAEGYKSYDLIYLCYHSSWDWLMPVVEKIEKIHTNNYFNNKATESDFVVGMTLEEDNHVIITIHFKQPDPAKQRKIKQIVYKKESKIEAVWLAVVEFIKWFNNNNK